MRMFYNTFKCCIKRIIIIAISTIEERITCKAGSITSLAPILRILPLNIIICVALIKTLKYKSIRDIRSFQRKQMIITCEIIKNQHIISNLDKLR